jgi:hypothetical protein
VICHCRRAAADRGVDGRDDVAVAGEHQDIADAADFGLLTGA